MKEYVEDLYDQYKGLIEEYDIQIENIMESHKDNIGPNITKSRFVKALSKFK